MNALDFPFSATDAATIHAAIERRWLERVA